MCRDQEVEAGRGLGKKLGVFAGEVACGFELKIRDQDAIGEQGVGQIEAGGVLGFVPEVEGGFGPALGQGEFRG